MSGNPSSEVLPSGGAVTANNFPILPYVKGLTERVEKIMRKKHISVNKFTYMTGMLTSDLRYVYLLPGDKQP